MRFRATDRLALAVLVSYLAIFGISLGAGWVRTWDALTVPAMYPPFADLRMVTGVQRVLDQGLDPMRINTDPGDPWDRPFNYPRVWIYIATGLHWTPENTNWVGLSLFGSFIAGLMIIGSTLSTRSDYLLMYAAALSPAVLFGVERGNVDLFLFFLVCVAIALHARPWLQATALGAAGVLKLYPAFGLAVPPKPGRRNRFALHVLWIVLMAVYVYLTRGDLPSISRGTRASPDFSYGFLSLGSWIASTFRLPWPVPTLMAAAITASAITAGVWSAFRRRAASADQLPDVPDITSQAFLMASAIYVGSFCFRSNYDYRLMFLLPGVPYLNQLGRSASPAQRRLGRGGLTVLYLALSQTLLEATVGHRAGLAMNHLAKIALVGVMCAAATERLLAQEWRRQESPAFSGRAVRAAQAAR
jgi:hypothetical protein